MDIQIVRSFATVARVGSVTAAARELNYSQPSVTAHLVALERRMGGRLFDRGGRGMVLTELGTRVLPHADTLLEQLDLLLQEHAATGGQPVTVGYWPPPLLPLLDRLRAVASVELPQVVVRAVAMPRAADIEHALLSAQHDLQLAPGPMTDRRIVATRMASLRVGVRMSLTHPLAGLPSLRIGDILDERTYGLGGVPLAWHDFWTATEARGAAAEIRGERHTFAECLAPVGPGTIMLCPSLVGPYLPTADTWRLVQDHPGGAVMMAWRSVEQRPAVLALGRLWRLIAQAGGSTTLSASSAQSSANG